jgi:phage-related protein
MPEIIGSAYVRIRAVTTQLAGDIKDGIDKGAGDAKVDAAGKKVGTDFSDGMSKGVDEQAPDFHKHVNESVSGSGKDVDKHGNFLGRRLAKGMGDGVDEGDRGPNGPTGRFKKIFDGFDKFANSFNLPPIAWTALFALGALGPVVQIAGSYIAGLVAQLGFVVTAAAGAGAALAGLVGIAAIAAVPIVLAFKVDTPQLESFKQFAKDIGKSWQEVGKATQKTLLPGLTVALKMSAALIPAFRLFGSAIGGVVGDAAKMTAGFLSSQRNAGFLHDVMSASVDIVKKLTSAFALLIDSVLPFFSAAAPVAKVLADQILKIADHFDKFIRSTSQSGQLTATLDLWYGRFTLIMRILANVGRMLGTVFRIGAGQTSLRRLKVRTGSRPSLTQRCR